MRKRYIALLITFLLFFSLFLLIQNIPYRQTTQKKAAETSGTAGDFITDTIFGKSDFGETVPNQVVGNRTFLAHGTLIDRSVSPNRLYIWDSGNSRILGFSSLGTCTGGSKSGQGCTNDLDCPSSTCTINSYKEADIVLGQPDKYHAACNSDSTYRVNPTAATLCSQRYPYQISLMESPEPNSMAVDQNHNLYVVDKWNQRVLKYNDPFATDRIADQVWGQSNFTGKECNRGNASPDSSRLCISDEETCTICSTFWGAGLDVEPDGSHIWVADGANRRVLRFPTNSSQADLVIGQNDFFSKDGSACRNYSNSPDNPEVPPLNLLCKPKAVRYNPATRQLLVLDWPGNDHQDGLRRILVYREPFTNGMPAAEVIYGDHNGTYAFLGNQANGSYYQMYGPTGIEIDPFTPNAFWLSDTGHWRVLYFKKQDNGKWQPTKVLGQSDLNSTRGENYHCPATTSPPDLCRLEDPAGGIGIDSAGNIYVNNNDEQHLLRFPPPSAQPGQMTSANAVIVRQQTGVRGRAGVNFIGPSGIHSPNSLLSIDYANGQNQLLADDNKRILVWNNYSNKSSGAPADYVLFQSGFYNQKGQGGLVRQLAKDSSGRIWVAKEWDGVYVFQGPITASSTPTIIPNTLPIKNSPALLTLEFIVGVAYDEPDDALWVADNNFHRLVRIQHPLDSSSRKVDLVLGQPNSSSRLANRGVDDPGVSLACPHIVPDGFGNLNHVNLDNYGNLYVSDMSHEGWQCSNNRLLEFDRTDIEQKITRGVVFFDSPDENQRLLPKRAYGKSGFYANEKNVFGRSGYPNLPISVSFGPQNRMLIMAEAYGNDNLERIYLLDNPLLPCPSGQLRCHMNPAFTVLESGSSPVFGSSYIIPLSIASPVASSWDNQNNIVLADHTWNRILFFTNPFNSRPPTPTPTAPPDACVSEYLGVCVEPPMDQPAKDCCVTGVANVTCDQTGAYESSCVVRCGRNEDCPVCYPKCNGNYCISKGNLDCDVQNLIDETDLLIILTKWNQSGGADLNADGVINNDDIEILKQNWQPI